MPQADGKAHFDKIKAKDKELRPLLAAGADNPLDTLAKRTLATKLLGDRGMAKLDVGSAKDGLQDVLRAFLAQTGRRDVLALDLNQLLDQHAKQAASIPPSLEAKLGEALRRYASEVALNLSQREQVEGLLKRSIECFDRALADEGISKPLMRWALAHRAAARTTQLWMAKGKGWCQDPSGKDLDLAARDFEAALAISKIPYAWCLRYYAIFLTLRRAKGDLAAARELLEAAAMVEPSTPVERGLAMLDSYVAADAAVPLPERETAANSSLTNALSAIQVDSEDFVARYFAAAAHWWLSRNAASAEERQIHKDNLQPAIESAEVGSMSAIAQAVVTLAGLWAMRALPAAPTSQQGRDAIASAQKAIGLLTALDIPLDLEAAMMFRNDPVFTVLNNLPNDDSSTPEPPLKSALKDLYQSAL
jgi:tetratricopeptide (TPR) repeat protein